MDIYERLQKEIKEVDAAFDLLTESVESVIAEIQGSYIPQESCAGNMKNVLEGANLCTALSKYIENIKELKDSCTILEKVNYDKEEIEEKEEESALLSVSERTTWIVDGDTIRIETIRSDKKSSYSNNVPINIFVDLVHEVEKYFELDGNKTIKTSVIKNTMSERIKKETYYKKSPNTVVYSVFKILIKEGILIPYGNSKRIYTMDKGKAEIEEWMKQNNLL